MKQEYSYGEYVSPGLEIAEIAAENGFAATTYSGFNRGGAGRYSTEDDVNDNGSY